jgi:hypothetical protein
MVKALGTSSARTGQRSLGLLASAGFAFLACQASLDLDAYQIVAGGGAGTAGTGPSAGTGPGGSGGAGGSSGAGGTYAGAGGSSAGSGGAGGCGEPPAKACPTPQVAVSGVVSVYDTQQPLAGARVETDGESVATDAQGNYSLQVPRDTLVPVTVEWPEGSGATVPAFRRTLLSFHSGAEAARSLDIPAVSHDWLETVAKDCGALAADTPAADVQRYFNGRSTLVVDVVGEGVAGIIDDQINVDVELDGSAYSNFENPDPDATWPTRICFLDGPDAGGELRGGTVNQTTGLGRFVVFRVRNENGLGTGRASVRIVNFDASEPVEFVGAGSSAVVRVGGGW